MPWTIRFERVKTCQRAFFSRGGIIYVLLLSVQNLDRSDDGRFVVSGMYGIAFLCRRLFRVAHDLLRFIPLPCNYLLMYCRLSSATNLLHRCTCLKYFHLPVGRRVSRQTRLSWRRLRFALSISSVLQEFLKT